MRFGPNLKRYLPRSLFARTILIILIPLAAAQLMATWVFYDRHYQSVSTRLALGVAGDVQLLQTELTSLPPELSNDIIARVHEATGLVATINEGRLPSGVGAGDLIRQTLGSALIQKGMSGFRFGAYDSAAIVLYLPLDKTPKESHYLQVRIPQHRLHTPTTWVFLGWMVGGTMLLVIVSLIFMRNQIRPIRRLALAAERFGRTLESESFKPEGALEVRQAAAAFLVMRSRLRRLIEQRTAMLAAISHDLRTPLTRMRLGLALLPQQVREEHDIDALDGDIGEMERMIGAYLAFARGEEAEAPEETNLSALVEEIATRTATVAAQTGVHIWWKNLADAPLSVTARREALRRAINNLMTNAAKYGRNVWITLAVGDYTADIAVEDDGPGIPESEWERVFKPFFRLESENTLAADRKPGHGLGLTIARDIARAHGGDVLLSASPHGGLKATLRLPV